VRADGAVVRFAIHASCAMGPGGAPEHITGVVRDVTAKREAERLLRLSEARFRSLVLATSQSVWITGLTGSVSEDSPSWRAFTGQSYEEYKGFGWLEAVHPDDRARVWETWNEARTTGKPHEVEYRARRHDGVYRYLAVRAAPVTGPDGVVREWVGATQDVTERMEEELERARLLAEVANQRAQLAAVLDAMPAGVIIAAAPGGRVIFANRYAERLLRGSPKHVETRALHEKHRAWTIDGTELDPGELPLLRAIDRGDVTSGVEIAFEVHKGEIVYLRCNAAPVPDGGGKTAAGVCAFEDITREIEAKHQREQAERFRELFVGMLGHDLRDPLAAMVTGAGLLLQRGSLTPEDVKVAERIAAAGARMRRMIGQILDLTRSRLGGGIPVAPRRTDVHELTRRIIEEAEAAHPGRKIALLLQGDPSCVCDPDRIAQVLQNLVGNALHHTAPDVPVEVTVTCTDRGLRFSVHNDGPPIPPETLPVLFDPFRRAAEAAQRDPAGGLGLGLYISQQIVAAHGGRIDVASTQEEGTTFTVVLPA
jgi:PAS domain S-box-containing protein